MDHRRRIRIFLAQLQVTGFIVHCVEFVSPAQLSLYLHKFIIKKIH